jgi:hypothetical protein
MKISKVTWIFVIIGIVAIAGASLGMAHSRQTEQQNQLQQQIAQAKQKAALINNNELLTRQSQLNQEIKSYDGQLESAQTKLMADEDSISAADRILATGRNFNLQVEVLTQPGLSNGDLAGADCDILEVSIQVSGNMTDINNFVKDLSRQFPTSIVTSVNISNDQAPEEAAVPEEPVGEGTEEPETEAPPEAVPEESAVASAPSGSINLVIYEYRSTSSQVTP